MGKNKSDRSLYYAFVIYPGDSAPENWLEILKAFRLNMFISPPHHPDSDPVPGEPEGTAKKVHRHVMVYFDSVKSQKQASEISEAVNGTAAFAVHSKAGYTRYLCHLDNPEKEKLSPEDVITIGSIVYEDNCADSVNRKKVIWEMIVWCEENCIFSFRQLVEYAHNNNESWYSALTESCAYIMKEWLTSYYWEMKNKAELVALAGYVKENGLDKMQVTPDPGEPEFDSDGVITDERCL